MRNRIKSLIVGAVVAAIATVAWMPAQTAAAPLGASTMQYYFVPIWNIEFCYGGCEGSVCCQVIIAPTE